jgi:excisionase family DNA binding protein
MLNSKELCSKLGIHINTLYRWIDKGFPHYRVNKKMMFDYEEILKWIRKKGE